MVGINITNKEINLLVNGNQGEKFIQRASAADYDVGTSVSVSTTQKKIWEETVADRDGSNAYLTTTDMTPNYVGEGNCDVTVTAYCNEQNGNPQWYDVIVDIAGNQFVDYDDLTFSGDSVSVNGVDLSNNSITVEGGSDEAFDSQTAVIKFVVEVSGEVPTGYSTSVDGITQSTSPDINFSDKDVDILFNGSYKANFTQTAPAADYNVEAGATTNSTRQQFKIYDGPMAEDSFISQSVPLLDAPFRKSDFIELELDIDNASTMEILKNGSVVQSYSGGQTVTNSFTATASDTVAVSVSTGLNNGASFAYATLDLADGASPVFNNVTQF